MKIGDLVKTVRGYSEPGLVVNIGEEPRSDSDDWSWITILWPDAIGVAASRRKDLKVVS